MALPKIGYPTYELELPSNGKTIKYRPFVVKEEKVLLLTLEGEPNTPRDLNNLDHILEYEKEREKWEVDVKRAVKELIKNCVVSRIKVDDLPTFDLEYLFLNIRAVSISDDIKITVTCKDDGTTQVPVTINVDDIKVTKPEGHTNKIMLTDDTGIIMKYPSMDRFIDQEFIGKEIKTDEIFEFIAGHIDQIFDSEDVYDASSSTKKELVNWVENLTTSQFEKIQDFYITMPKLEHTVTVTNPNTGVETKYTIEGMSSFFV